MDASADISDILIGLRSGLILALKLTYTQNLVTNIEQCELGFHQNSVLQVKISGDGSHAVSGGLDDYVALFSVKERLLLQKIAVPEYQITQSLAINLTGEIFLFATNYDPNIQVYCNDMAAKQVNHLGLLKAHNAQVTSLSVTYDGLVGVSGSLDTTIAIWNIMELKLIRQIDLLSPLKTVKITPMGKFIACNTCNSH